MDHYYKELPEGFQANLVIDAQKPKNTIISNLIALAIMAGCIAGGYFLKGKGSHINFSDFSLLHIFLILVTYIFYIILHELMHGLVYKLMTKQKLTFGFNLKVAYCGVKDGYIGKKCALCALLAPFVLHSIWMVLLMIFLPFDVWFFLVLCLFAGHFGGCVFDLFDTGILLIKYHHQDVLMKDTGPKQIFYVKKNQNFGNTNIEGEEPCIIKN